MALFRKRDFVCGPRADKALGISIPQVVPLRTDEAIE